MKKQNRKVADGAKKVTWAKGAKEVFEKDSNLGAGRSNDLLPGMEGKILNLNVGQSYMFDKRRIEEEGAPQTETAFNVLSSEQQKTWGRDTTWLFFETTMGNISLTKFLGFPDYETSDEYDWDFEDGANTENLEFFVPSTYIQRLWINEFKCDDVIGKRFKIVAKCKADKTARNGDTYEVTHYLFQVLD